MASITEYIEIILAGNDLSFDQAKALLDTVFDGDIAEVQIAAFLTAMRAKTAVPTELAGLAGSLRAHAVPVKVDPDTIIDRATYQCPQQYSAGVRHVVVNGSIALEDAELTSLRAGRFLRKGTE